MNTQLVCAKPDCKMELLKPRGANPVDETPVLGDLLVCGCCFTINVIDLNGTHIITEAEAEGLDADTRADLAFVARFNSIK